MSLKVVCVVDKTGTALDRLAKGVVKYHDNIEYKVIAVHPKRPDQIQLQTFEDEARTADIIDWQYFRTAEMLRERYDWLKDKKQILTHNNAYSYKDKLWNDYDMVVANNLTIYNDLKPTTTTLLEYIPLTVDADFWTYNSDWQKDNSLIMVANRIESKKGILPVAIACKDADIKMVLVGNVSDVNYMNEIMNLGNVEFHENVSDDELKRLYYSSGLHVCNSVDNFESGTLPILEAMLCGTPVLTRNVGHVPDLYNQKNMELLNTDPDDVPYITRKIKDLLQNNKKIDNSVRDKLNEMRRAAWETAKSRNFERRAYSYQKLYRKVLYNNPSVSIILPIYDKVDLIRKNLEAISNQTYKNIEVVVCDDNPIPNATLIHDFEKFVDFPLRYIHTATKENDYGLARARNRGIIEATGDILVFCDERIIMESTAVEEFVNESQLGTWLFGDKNGKTNFVENFSSAFRSDVVKCGMFNERVNEYGGQSQELRSRINKQGMQVRLIPKAKANQVGKSRNKWTKQAEIIRMKNLLFKIGLL